MITTQDKELLAKERYYGSANSRATKLASRQVFLFETGRCRFH